MGERKSTKRKQIIIEPVVDPIVELVVEMIEPIVELAVESINPEESFCLQFHRFREFRTRYNLSDFSYWMFYIRKVNKEFLETYKSKAIIVEIIEPVVESHFNCKTCNFTIKRTEHNQHHTKCIDCFYPNRIRGKCLVILDV